MLKLIKYVSSELGLDIVVETEAYLEGGLIERWKLVSNKPAVLSALFAGCSLTVAIVTLCLSRHPVSTANPQLENLNIQIAELQLEKLKSEIKLIREKENEKKHSDAVKKAVEDLEKKRNLPKDITVQSSVFPYQKDKLESVNYDSIKALSDLENLNLTTVFHNLDSSYKVSRMKSNFYLSLNSYGKVTKISTTPLSDDNLPIEPPSFVLREQFSDYIIESDELPLETIEPATIEIVSPVLRKGKFKWKGIYEGQNIDFYMKDTSFKKLIFEKKITFQTGIYIECKLEIQKRLDDLGNVNIVNYSVSNVLSCNNGSDKITFAKPKLKSNRNPSGSQFDIDLFSNTDD